MIQTEKSYPSQFQTVFRSSTGGVPAVPGFRGRPPVLARNLLPLDEANDDDGDDNGGVVAKIRAGRQRDNSS